VVLRGVGPTVALVGARGAASAAHDPTLELLRMISCVLES
jgi:hypothetical protein